MTEIKYQFLVIQAIRNFFTSQGFLDVLTPPMVSNPGMETHIHPFEVYSKIKNETTGLYLHTSPEFHMKKLLNELEIDNIFTISYCFRNEPASPIHREQFVMCEWYRKHEHYTQIMQDCENLINYTWDFLERNKAPVKHQFKNLTFKRMTVQELFWNYLQFDILDFLDRDELKRKIEKDFPNVPLPTQLCQWDDYFFLLMLNEIEPHFINHDYLLLYEFPHHLSALSTLKPEDKRVCERFEIYLNGVELCNSFNELTDYQLQKNRFDQQMQIKKELYGYDLPEPNEFYQTLKNGYPRSSGIALGVERLTYSLLDIKNPFFK
jgi:elongation factor P--(R)-beta-lysine ligase